MQITHSTIYSTILSTILSDLPERPKVQIPAWVAENKVTGEKTIQQFNSTTKQTELEDIILKKMITKFEKVNKSFNSLKPLLSKVLTKAKENKTKTYMGNLGNSVSRGQRFTRERVSYSILHDSLTSNRKNIPSY